MLKVQAEPTFWATAKIAVPGQNDLVPMDVEYKWLGKEKLREFFDSINDKDDATVLGEIVVNWRGVDSDFSADNLSRLIDMYSTAADAIFTTFKDELLLAKEKN